MITVRLTEVREIPKYYDNPTMVCFYDPDYAPCFEADEDPSIEPIPLIVGIAYCSEIICGCCGGIYDLGNISEYCAPAIGYHEMAWIPFDFLSECIVDIREKVEVQQERWTAFCAKRGADYGEYWHKG